MSISVSEALTDSIILSADNPAHAEDVRVMVSRSIVRGDVALIDGTRSQSPALASATAKVMLGTLDVEFSHMMGAHSAWKRTGARALDK